MCVRLRTTGLGVETTLSNQNQTTSRVAIDLLLDLDRSKGKRDAVETALRDAIRGRRLTDGDVLPSTRSLANDLGVSRATVVAAYEQLASEGYITARQGSATAVTFAGTERSPSPHQYLAATDPDQAVYFHPGRPDLSGFPRREWQIATRTVLKTVPDVALDYPDPAGRPEFRRSIASYLARTRATVSDAADMVVTAGFLPALGLLARHFARAGAGTIAVENPMLYKHRLLLEYLGVTVIPVDVDHEGISVAGLDRVEEPIDAVLVCPARQYPLGMTMTPYRRADLVEWARRRNVWIVEDDYDGEFRYDDRPIGALQGLAPDRVVHAGTASKTLAPGVRLGWLTVPEELRRSMAFDVMANGAVSALDQMTLATMIDSGAYDRQVRTMRARYRRRRDATIAELGSIAGVSIPNSSAGLSICVRFDGDASTLDDRRIEAVCFAGGVGVVALSRHFADPHRSVPGLVVGFAAPPEHEFPTALQRLQSVLREALST